jgi:hypothetical protein
MLVASLILRQQLPPTRRLRQVGWTLVTTNIASGIWMIAWYL